MIINDVKQIIKILNNGGVIIFPTEMLYGLGCDATNPRALLKIYQVKNRELGKSFPLLVKDLAMLSHYASLNQTQKKMIKTAGGERGRTTKKPTTFILKAKNLSPLVMQQHTAAFRMATHPWVKRLFRGFDRPVVATSANLSGQKTLADPRKYREVFGKKSDLIDAVVFVGVNRKTKPSRLVDISGKQPVILRK